MWSIITTERHVSCEEALRGGEQMRTLTVEEVQVVALVWSAIILTYIAFVMRSLNARFGWWAEQDIELRRRSEEQADERLSLLRQRTHDVQARLDSRLGELEQRLTAIGA